MQFEWTVFFGDAADAEARVYVLATPSGDPAGAADAAALQGLKITGRVEGPKCRYSHTLPARIPVRHRGVRTSDGKAELLRPELVGEAIVPDPNFWTPDLPFLYRAIVEVRRGDEIVATYEQDFGIRPLGVRGKRLVFDGKTWVPRAVRREVVVGDAPLELWRETATVMVVDDPDDELCREASECGVVVFARLTKRKPFRGELRRLRRFPAVAVIVFDPNIESEVLVSGHDRSNVVLAYDREYQATEVGSYWPFMFEAYVVDCGRFENQGSDTVARQVSDYLVPSLIQRNTGKRTLVEARAECDELQAELAGKCDPAGYIV